MADRTLDLAEVPFLPIELEDGELLDGAILVVRTLLDGDKTRLVTRTSDGLDWITARGMVEVAHDNFVEASLSVPNEEE